MDIINGKCVRLAKGDYNNKTEYNTSPLEMAKQLEAAGLTRLHLVDLDGAKHGNVVHWKVLEAIATHTSLYIDFSGGISTTTQAHTCFNAGAQYISIGSIAVTNEALLYQWITLFGNTKIIIGADVKNGYIAIKGWTELAHITLQECITKYITKGLNQYYCTDVSKDGLLQGPNNELYTTLIHNNPTIQLIASGGISTIAQLHALKTIGCTGAIVGKALYEGKIKINDLATFV